MIEIPITTYVLLVWACDEQSSAFFDRLKSFCLEHDYSYYVMCYDLKYDRYRISNRKYRGQIPRVYARSSLKLDPMIYTESFRFVKYLFIPSDNIDQVYKFVKDKDFYHVKSQLDFPPKEIFDMDDRWAIGGKNPKHQLIWNKILSKYD